MKRPPKEDNGEELKSTGKTTVLDDEGGEDDYDGDGDVQGPEEKKQKSSWFGWPFSSSQNQQH